MSCHIESSYSYGSGEYGDYTVPSSGKIINNYARVTNISGKKLIVENVTNNGLVPFQVGTYVLLHIAATTATTKFAARGEWRTNLIAGYDTTNHEITLTKTFSSALAGYNLNNVCIQLITIPHFKTLTIPVNTSITCPPFDATTKVGGVVAFRAKHLKFSGGHIDVAGKGLPNDTFWANGDFDGESSYDNLVRKSAGWENFKAKTHIPLNYPDGAVWFAVEKLTCHSSSRIGNPNAEGSARNRGRVTNPQAFAGGSSIFIAAKEIAKVYYACFAKYCSLTSGVGKGMARCYIASETTLPTDEGLYAYDKISNSSRLKDSCNVNGFYDGTAEYVNQTGKFNSYAVVKKITLGDDTTTLQIAVKDSGGKTKFGNDKLVMVHLTHKKNDSKSDMELSGRFWLSKITSVQTNTDGSIDKITLDSKIPFTQDFLSNYYVQVVTVTRLKKLTLTNVTNTGTPKFTIDGSYAYGGIFAVAVNDTLELNGGKISVENKGGALPYGSEGLKIIGNAQMCDRLPIGQGHGSVFILAKNLTMNDTSRIGATYSGMPLGGYAYTINSSTKKADTSDNAKLFATDQKFGRQNADDLESNTVGGYGGANGGGFAGAENTGAYPLQNGGYGSNGGGSDKGAPQGAHVFIVADTITGFNINAISTGGAGSGDKYFVGTATAEEKKTSAPGGAGYGGSGGTVLTSDNNYPCRGGNGGFIGGGAGAGGYWKYSSGGGSGAFCFVYCNNAVSQNKTGITTYSTEA